MRILLFSTGYRNLAASVMSILSVHAIAEWIVQCIAVLHYILFAASQISGVTGTMLCVPYPSD